MRETTDILLEATPKSVNLAALVADIQQIQRVEGVHDVHVWSITNGMYALSAHIQTANMPLSECALMIQEIKSLLRETYRIGHTTLQFECDGHQGACSEMDGLYCQMESSHAHHEEPASAAQLSQRCPGDSATANPSRKASDPLVGYPFLARVARFPSGRSPFRQSGARQPA